MTCQSHPAGFLIAWNQSEASRLGLQLQSGFALITADIKGFRAAAFKPPATARPHPLPFDPITFNSSTAPCFTLEIKYSALRLPLDYSNYAASKTTERYKDSLQSLFQSGSCAKKKKKVSKVVRVDLRLRSGPVWSARVTCCWTPQSECALSCQQKWIIIIIFSWFICLITNKKG